MRTGESLCEDCGCELCQCPPPVIITDNRRIAELERQVAALTKELNTANEKVLRVVRGEFTQICSYCGWEAGPDGAQWEDLQAHIKQCETHPASKLAAAQAVNEKLREAQWRNIRAVVKTLADWAFGSKDDPRWGTAWIAMVSGLTAKDGPEFQLETLAFPSDTTALQARLAEEREKVIALYSSDDTAQDWIDKIRSMK